MNTFFFRKGYTVLLKLIVGLVSVILTSQCSQSVNSSESENENNGAIVGMFEIEVVTWGDRFSGIHSDGIKLHLINTLTNEVRTAETTNGFYYFDNLRKGNYRIYQATMNKENLNLVIDLSMFMVVLDSYISVMGRMRLLQGLRLKSFNEKGINNKAIRMNYPTNEPFDFIKTTFEERKESGYRLLAL